MQRLHSAPELGTKAGNESAFVRIGKHIFKVFIGTRINPADGRPHECVVYVPVDEKTGEATMDVEDFTPA